jgi:hypothetical protein
MISVVNQTMVLDYLKVLLTWPVIGGSLIATFLLLFRAQIQSLINRTGRIKFPGGEFSTSQQEKIEEVGGRTQPGPITPATPSPPELGGMHLTKGDLAEIQAYFQAERATARIWEYRYLNYGSSCKRVGDFRAEGPTNRWIA